ncbi:MAG: hypothetical protein KAX49_00040 [Halanaerobiales bacterium]|nr:hypothetical protein [Halanaerobiales bacterium]
MEQICVEKLVNLVNYQFVLNFELPLNLSVEQNINLNAEIKEVKKYLRSDGLMISGSILEDMSFKQETISQIYCFTYLVPLSDIKETNLLNFEIEVSIEKIQHHLIRTKGQVFLKQQFQMKLVLAEYQVKECYRNLIKEFQKKSGFFLKKVGKFKESFLKIYPIILPEDFFIVSKVVGLIKNHKVELINNGCLIDIFSSFQGEYVTDQQKMATFFFEAKENFFLPISEEMSRKSDETLLTISLGDLILEDGELMVLYHCTVQLLQKKEYNYYTGELTTCPLSDDIELKTIQVENVSQMLRDNQMVKEVIELKVLLIKEVIKIYCEFKKLKIEQTKENLLLSGELEYTLIYITVQGKECSHQWLKRINKRIQLKNFDIEIKGFWQMDPIITIPAWEFQNEKLVMETMIDYQGFFYYQFLDSVITAVSGELEEVNQEKFYVNELIDADQIFFEDSEKVYLLRYASQILRIDSRIKGCQIRTVQGGWVVKGEGELAIYYLTQEGEMHISKQFSFYRFLPCNKTLLNLSIIVDPGVQVLDQEMLEDGSLIRIQYLINIDYQVFQKREEKLVIGVSEGVFQESLRPILQMGSVAKNLSYRISISDKVFFQQVKVIEDLQLFLRDYQIKLSGEELKLVGEAEIKIKYLNIWGRQKKKVLTVPVEITEKVSLEDELYQTFRVIPRVCAFIKDYEYMLEGHPQKSRKMKLSFGLEMSYRLLGVLKRD